jgi:hypothetical protein
MDVRHGARLARSSFATPTRRALVRLAVALGLAKGLTGTSLAAFLVEQPAAAKKGGKKRCSSGLTTCKVKRGKKKKTICVNADTNSSHCGGCNLPCPAGVACVNGACQDTTTCMPECPANRECFEGACTCQTSTECDAREDPSGDWCNGVPGQPSIGVCGCLEGMQVCAGGERCSHCCTNEACETASPGERYICAMPLPNTYFSRECCKPNGVECGNQDQCCSRHCDTSTRFPGICKCRQAGETCVYGQSCCSGICSPTNQKCT